MSLDANMRALVRDVVMTDVVPVLVRELAAVIASQAGMQADAGGRELLKVSDVAREAKVADATVLEWIRRGDLKASTLPGGREYRVRRADLDRAMSGVPAQTSAPAPELEAARIVSLSRGRLRGTGGT